MAGVLAISRSVARIGRRVFSTASGVDCCCEPSEVDWIDECLASCDACPTGYTITFGATTYRIDDGSDTYDYTINGTLDVTRVLGMFGRPCVPDALDDGEYTIVIDGCTDADIPWDGWWSFYPASQVICDGSQGVARLGCGSLVSGDPAIDVVTALGWTQDNFLELNVSCTPDCTPDPICWEAYLTPLGATLRNRVGQARWLSRVPSSGCLTDAQWVAMPIATGSAATLVPLSDGGVTVT